MTTRRPKIFGKRSRLLLSMRPKVMFIGSIIVTLTVVHIIISHQKLWFWFWHLKGMQGQIWLRQSKAHGCFKKVIPAFHLISVTISKIFRIKGLRPWPLTSQGHPKWSTWVQHRNFCHSWHISRQKVWPWFFTPSRSSKVKSDDAKRKPVGISALGVQPGICHRFQNISNQRIVTLICNLSRSSKVKYNGANRKPIGTFLHDFCWVQHRISHRLTTNHQRNQSTN